MKNTITTMVILFSLSACTAELETGSDPGNPVFQPAPQPVTQQDEQKQPAKATGPADAKSLQCQGAQTLLSMDFSQADFVADQAESSLATLQKIDSLSVEIVTLSNVSLVRINDEVHFEFVSDASPQPTHKVEFSTKDFVTATAKLIVLNSSESMSCQFFQLQE